MTFLLYLATALFVLWLAHRWVSPLSRTTAIVLVLMPLCFTARALLTDKVYAPVDLPYATEPLNHMRSEYGIGDSHNGILNDIGTQMIPYRAAVRHALQRSEWPIWNPFTMSGEILAAAAQPAPYSPLTLLACLLPVALSFTYTAAIWFFIAGICAYLFARELGCREVVALIAAAGWMYATCVSFFILWPLAHSWILLPLVLLATRRLTEWPGLANAVLLTVSLTLTTLAGHPETLVHVVFVGAFYGLMEIVAKRATAGRAVAWAAGAGLVTLMLCAIYILPILEAAPQTMEHRFRYEVFAVSERGVHRNETLARWATDFLPFLHLRRWKVEKVRELMPFDSAAVGSIMLAAAVYATWRVRGRQKWFLTLLFLFSILGRGEWPPLARLLQKLPLLDIALNERFSFSAAFAMVALAALGIEDLCTRENRRAAAATFTVVLLLLSGATLAVLDARVVGGSIEKWGDYKIFGEFFFLPIVILLLLFRLPSHALATLILGLLLAQRTVEDTGAYPIIDRRAAYPPVPIFEPLKAVREPFRVVGIGLTFIPGTSALYGLEDARGYSAMTLERYFETYPLWCTHQPVWFNRVDDLTRPFLSFLNVRYAVAFTKFPTPEGWVEVATQRGSKLLENSRVIERAFVPRSVRIGFSDPDTFVQMAEETDFRERAWIRAPITQHERPNGPGTVRIRRRKHGFGLDADMQNGGWVVISQPAWKGWRAYIDGRRVRHQIANGAFLGIYVPQGKHKLRVVYRPDAFVTGRAISGTTLLGVMLFGAYRTTRRRSASGASPRTT
ncbi:MAG TPA: YfhO family protein [Thermoanaerobaculia bacterium]|nr:YfhO family protein [Thermoanaerobaculia bacterium]